MDAVLNFTRLQDLIDRDALKGKRVFIRADLNVPQDDAGNITEDTRIRASVPAIRAALESRRRRDGDLPPGPSDRGRIQAGRQPGAGRQRACPSCWASRSN
jgi:hypothetical protein